MLKRGFNEYNKLLDEKIYKCIEYLENNKYKKYGIVNINLFGEITINNKGYNKTYKIHNLHYGPMLKNIEKLDDENDIIYYWRRFKTRDILSFLKSKYSVFSVFQNKQIEMLQKGYYLIDISDTKHDTEKDKIYYNTKILLYKEKPNKPIKRWHSYGHIPTLGKFDNNHKNTKKNTNNKNDEEEIIIPETISLDEYLKKEKNQIIKKGHDIINSKNTKTVDNNKISDKFYDSLKNAEYLE